MNRAFAAVSRKRRGFTLIELLVVIAHHCGLDRTLAPRGAGCPRGALVGAQCVNNLKQLGLPLMNYESSHGSFPMAFFWQWCDQRDSGCAVAASATPSVRDGGNVAVL